MKEPGVFKGLDDSKAGGGGDDRRTMNELGSTNSTEEGEGMSDRNELKGL